MLRASCGVTPCTAGEISILSPDFDGSCSGAQPRDAADEKAKWFREWLAKDATAALIGFLNQIAGLAAISDPCALPRIREVIHSGSFFDFEAVENGIDEYQPILHDLYRNIGLEPIENARRKVCIAAESQSRDKTIDKIIRLMNTHTRKQIKGPVAAAYRIHEVAETLRRVREAAFEQELIEEDELGFGQVIVSTKIMIQGDRRLLDGKQKVKRAFLRSVGLDYGLRVNLYVEGATEFGAMDGLFAGSGVVIVRNLAGQITEKRGKGLAFRESLEHDIQSNIFSFVLLDGDVSDNVRAVKAAARGDAICGAFLISRPDFELCNFTIDELSKIISDLLADFATAPDSGEILEAISGSSSARDMFQRFKRQFPTFCEFRKGHRWGEALINYAWENPEWTRVDGSEPTMRPIMEFVQWVMRAPSVSYVISKKQNRVNPDTGRPERRI
jgi:hypothetical protein